MRTARPLLSCALLVPTFVAVGTVLPQAAHATSCARDLETAVLTQPVQFVGRVVQLEQGVIRFRVEEVWAGPDLAPAVWVDAGRDGRGTGSSAFEPAAFAPEAGDRFLVGASGSLHSDPCSARRVDEDTELAALRPPTVRAAAVGGLEGEGPGHTVLLSGLAVALGAAAALAGLRRLGAAGGPRGDVGGVGCDSG